MQVLGTSAFALRAADATQVTGIRQCGKPGGGGNLPDALRSFENTVVPLRLLSSDDFAMVSASEESVS